MVEAKGQRLLLQIWQTAGDTGLENVIPDETRNSLQVLLRESLDAIAPGTQVIRNISDALDSRKLNWALLRNPNAGDYAYASDTRPFDSRTVILIPPAFHQRSLAALEEAGWKVHPDLHPRYLDVAPPVLLHPFWGGFSLEVRPSLLPGIPLPEEESLWDQLEKTDRGDVSVKIPSAGASAFFHCLVCFVFHRSRPAWSLLDVGLSCIRLDREGWDILTNLTVTTGVSYEVLSCLKAVAHRQGLSVPERVTSHLENQTISGMRRRMAHMTLAAEEDHASVAIHRLLMIGDVGSRDRYASFLLLPPHRWDETASNGPDGNPFAGVSRKGLLGTLFQLVNPLGR